MTIIEGMIALAILATGLAGIMGMVQSQAQTRASTVSGKQYLAVGRSIRERLETVPIGELTSSATAAAVTPRVWTAQRALGTPWSDGQLTAADGGLDEDDLIRTGILDRKIGDNLRVYIEFRQATSSESQDGVFDLGWMGNGEIRISDQPVDLAARWAAADPWGQAATGFSANHAAGVAIRVSLVWQEGSRASMIGTIPASGFRLHQFTFMKVQ
jgi:hypothetical protein